VDLVPPQQLIAMDAVSNQKAINPVIGGANQVCADRIANGQNTFSLDRPVANTLSKLMRSGISWSMRLSSPIHVTAHLFVERSDGTCAGQQLAANLDNKIGIAADERQRQLDTPSQNRPINFGCLARICDARADNGRRPLESDVLDRETRENAHVTR